MSISLQLPKSRKPRSGLGLPAIDQSDHSAEQPRRPKSKNRDPKEPLAPPTGWTTSSKTCLCGNTHKIDKCYVFHEKLRPENYKGPNTWCKANVAACEKVPALKKEIEDSRARVDKRLQGKEKATSNPGDTDQEGERPAMSAITVAPNLINTGISMTINGDHPLRKCWILDSGSNYHVTNDVSRIHKRDEAPLDVSLMTGNGLAPVEVSGELRLTPTLPGKDLRPEEKTFNLHNVCYAPHFPCSVVSEYLLKKKRFFYDAEKEYVFWRGPKTGIKITIAHIKKWNGLRLIVWNDAIETIRVGLSTVPRIPSENLYPSDPLITRDSRPVNQGPGEDAPPRSTGQHSAELWHRRLGHPGQRVLEHVEEVSRGVRIIGKGPKTVECNICATSKARAIISHDTPASASWEPGTRIFIDFFWGQGSSLSGATRYMLAREEVTGYLWNFIITHERNLLIELDMLFRLLQNQYGIRPRIVRIDKEGHASLENWDHLCAQLGILLEIIPTKTSEMAGSIERLGAIVNTRVRALVVQSRLPPETIDQIWDEFVHTAVLLTNLLPRASNQWKSPWYAWHSFVNKKLGGHFFQEKPDLSFLRPIGCKAFPLNEMGKAIAHHDALTLRERRKKGLSKYGPRAHIGYLIGYGISLFKPHAGNIYRIYVPHLKSSFTLSSRDVTFNEDDFYDPRDDLDRVNVPVEEMRKILFRLDLDGDLQDVDDALLEGLQHELPEFLSGSKTGLIDLNRNSTSSGGDHGPAPEANTAQPVPEDDTAQDKPQQSTLETEENVYDGFERLFMTPPSSPSTSIATLATEALATILTKNSDITFPPAVAATTYGTLPSLAGSFATLRESFSLITATFDGHPVQDFNAAVFAAIDNEQKRAVKLHAKDLPPIPKNLKEARYSRHWGDWKKAMEKEFRSHIEFGIYEEVDMEEAKGKVIPLMWVYDYKLTVDHFLQRFKARLVARGDQMPDAIRNYYAATLAARSFRLLIAIMAFFDLESCQMDAKTAFLNSYLDEPVYVYHPPGMQKKGKCLRLLKALYGLPQSALLWYRTLIKRFKELGLKPLPEEPCIVVNDWVIVFFFVDDIVFLFRKENTEKVEQLKKDLMESFPMADLGELRWFLGMRIIRDREQRIAYLCQDAYIEDMASRFSQTNGDVSTKYQSPRAQETLSILPKDRQDPSESSVKLYQEKIGCLIYLSTMSRPDLAEASSKLAQFNTRPSQRHHAVANRVIRYAYLTRYHALQFGGIKLPPLELFLSATDASHGDGIDRKSHHGMVMKAFGGCIYWKASKQTTVATSTTEAELIALSAGAKETIALYRLFDQMSLRLPSGRVPTIHCDNRQTIRLVTENGMKIQTALRHIDIQQHWLRDAVANGQLRVEWIPTTEMLADGFTKPLGDQKHQDFIQKLGLIEIFDLINRTK